MSFPRFCEYILSIEGALSSHEKRKPQLPPPETVCVCVCVRARARARACVPSRGYGGAPRPCVHGGGSEAHRREAAQSMSN